LYRASHARQTDRELIGDQLTNRANAAVAEVIDVVGVTAAFVELHQVADDGDEIFFGENRLAGGTIRRKVLVDLVAADASEIVSLRRKEQSLQRLLGGLAIGRVTGAQERVDLLERLVLGMRRILGKCVL